MVHHERQAFGDSCRMHALNAVLGRPHFRAWPDFLVHVCDAFDRAEGFPVGTSRAVTPPGFMEFALQQVDATLLATCFMTHETAKKHAVVQVLQARTRTDIVGLLAYSREHVWAVVPVPSAGGGHTWVTVDSLHAGPSPCSLSTLLQESVGFYLVTQSAAPRPPLPPVTPVTPPTHVPYHRGSLRLRRHLPQPPSHERLGPNGVRVVRVLHVPPLPFCGSFGIQQVDRARRLVHVRLR